jgi:NADH:ubiquinone oxidoreductase subunit F (NADH-binding)
MSIACDADETFLANPPEVPRLLSYADTGRTLTLREHVDRHGRLPSVGAAALLDVVEASGLTGRGGAAFPVHVKWRAVARGAGRRVVVANGAEGEPASAKDKTLLAANPHLALDGLQLAARAVGADRAVVYLHRHPRLVPVLAAAIDERRHAGVDRVHVEVVTAPPRFIAGEESAVAARVSGGQALPRSKPPRVFERGVDGGPTLVQNVETLSHVALIARWGAPWFRAVGPSEQPGSMLFTVSGAVRAPGVTEAPVGVSVRQLVTAAGGPTGPLHAVLLGGYHGTWVRWDDVADLALSNATLRPHGWSVGAGVVVALPQEVCGLTESARVLRYLATESAGQCGPCAFGLPSIADAILSVARPGRNGRAVAAAGRWAALVERRGACHHPDGTVRFLRSALTAFADELRVHDKGRCTATSDRPVLPVPPPTTVAEWR